MKTLLRWHSTALQRKRTLRSPGSFPAAPPGLDLEALASSKDGDGNREYLLTSTL
ncbi:MAG: hypothetical protein QOF89_2763 [Acidobacteriota bacterium]|jgi:hypothetical protein|nr:hypothetical protein [Acidobacteriota bacterium]